MRIPRSSAMVLCAVSGSACAACYVVIHSRQAATTPCRTRDRPMPNIRLILWGVLAAILFLNYQTWLHDYEPPVGTVQTSAAPAGAPASTLGDAVPQPPVSSPTAAPPTANAPPAA